MKEIWKCVPNTDECYEVSSYGRIRSYKNNRWGKSDTPKMLNPNINQNGYFRVSMYYTNGIEIAFLHRLVAESFIPNPKNKPYINHKDGNPLNNRIDNIEWCTHKENMHHAWDTGLINNRGERCGTSKLTREQVYEIRATWPLGWFTQKEIADAYDVGISTICQIVNNKTWTHI